MELSAGISLVFVLMRVHDMDSVSLNNRIYCLETHLMYNITSRISYHIIV